jgi:hypothetical protein
MDRVSGPPGGSLADLWPPGRHLAAPLPVP